MGWAKYDEDIRDAVEERWGDMERKGSFYFQTYGIGCSMAHSSKATSDTTTRTQKDRKEGTSR